ncbi:MAG: Bax inhibitor-1/YccA family protein [Oligoflexia bacterium]|nr:Bax inhibitor-1/YccA family protein [Oligoflexia bacterium]
MQNNSQQIAEVNAHFMSSVYRFMVLGVLTTAIIAYFVSQSPQIIYLILSNKPVFLGLLLAQFVLVFFFTTRIRQITFFIANVVFFGYSALTGITFSLLSLIYVHESIQNAFLMAAVAFAGLSAFGYFCKKDLGPIGTFCFMGLIGLIGYGLMSFFFPAMLSGAANTVYAIAGIIIFAGLTAYDTQKIKNMNVEIWEEKNKLAIYGALTLYLDFINLFLKMLRLIGRRK